MDTWALKGFGMARHVLPGMRSTVEMNTDGRLVIPAPIRRSYGLESGDLVEVEIRPVELTEAGLHE